jgi:hypothetical protein
MEIDLYTEKINKLDLFIEKYTDLLWQVIAEFTEVDPKIDLINFVNLAFLKRFYYNSISLRILLTSLIKDSNFNIPIGLILRTSISDVLTFYYFRYLAKTIASEPLFIEELKGFLVDNIHNIKTQLDYRKARKEISDQQYNNDVNSLIQKYDWFLIPGTTEFMKSKHIGFKQIATKLKEDKETQLVARIDEYYEIYSKYEHFGAFTFDLQEINKYLPDFDLVGYRRCCVHIFDAVLTIMIAYKLDQKYQVQISKTKMLI